MVDISHLQGSDAVGAVVVFTNGEPNKREYRRYKINQKILKMIPLVCMKSCIEDIIVD